MVILKDLSGQFSTNYGGGVGGKNDNKAVMQVGGRILTVSSKSMDMNNPHYGGQFD